jgi:hypothetical protein
MEDKLLPAIFGFLGAILGASISAVTTYIMGTRRERIERERESRTRAVDVMRAARLIEDDLGPAAVRVGLALNNNQWWDVALHPKARHDILYISAELTRLTLSALA